MPSDLPWLFVARYRATAWTDSHQHTGRTDGTTLAQGLFGYA
jgi:hypothetical protein